MPPLLLCLLFAAGADEGLGSALRQDGYAIRPPASFHTARMELFHGTHTGAVSTSSNTGRWLSAALVDGEGDDAASMLISIVEGSFKASPTTREELATAVVRHFSDELGLKLSIDRVELVSEPEPRVEVFGSVRQEAQVRHVLVAAMTGEGRHAVVTFSVPANRWEALQPAIRASLDSFRADAPQGAELPRGVAYAIAGVIAVSLALSVYVWRRRTTPRA